MNAATPPTHPYSINATDLLSLGVIALAVALIAGFKLPLLANPRTALIALVLAGMALCAGGIRRVSAASAWAHPIAILGYLSGTAILVITGAALLNQTLPLISSERGAFIAVTGLMAAKWLLTQIFALTR